MRWLILVLVGCAGEEPTASKFDDTGLQPAAPTADTAPPPPLCAWEGSWVAAVECGDFGPTWMLDTTMEITSLDGVPDECELRLGATDEDGVRHVEVMTLDSDTMEARAVVIERDGVPDDPPYTRSLGRLTISSEGAGHVLTFEQHLWGSGCGVPPIVTLTP